MADKSAIEWTDATWNPITGCSIVSPGCTNCYAMKLAGTRLKHIDSRKGLTRETKAGPVWTGEVRLNRQWLHQPLEWKKPRRIFVCAHGDLFAENVPDEWILDVFTVMAAADHHTYQVLTKRPDRMCEFLSRRDLLNDIYANWYTFTGKPAEVYSWPLHNVWCGASAEDQTRYDNRRRWLDETPAAARFWSLEPLLGPIEMNIQFVKPDWVIVGGESGHNARPMHPAWARSIRDQCAAAGVAFFFKQWGEWMPVKVVDDGDGPFGIGDGADPLHAYPNVPVYPARNIDGQDMWRVGKKRTGRLLDGIEHKAMPEGDFS
ncbi:phage Gp37/Gp68 family protein [Mesorhizobium sp. M0768]|uniref:phage Gp37/Gp68 family protein n=1 Tax=Mesorhizobium sp. M0768 TaxID=2956996 RepID=UPI0033395589